MEIDFITHCHIAIYKVNIIIIIKVRHLHHHHHLGILNNFSTPKRMALIQILRTRGTN
jgi:hypothetical protein